MKIAFICSEYEGLIKTGGLADATRGLAQALAGQGHQVEVILPRYGSLYHVPLLDEWQSYYFNLGDHTFGCAVRHCQDGPVSVALIEHHDFFQRERPYDDGYHAYADNALRFGFFCKAALCYLQQQAEPVAIVHGHDWQAALAACYLPSMRSGALTSSKFVLTIHNAAYQQGIGHHQLAELGLGGWHLPSDWPLSLLALGIWQTNALNTVSPSYRSELLSEPAANGLAALYQQRHADFVGILNGCDYSRWDPATDLTLPATYSSTDLLGKQRCKLEFCRQFSLAVDEQPLFVAVSRITEQKGFAYLIPALNQWLAEQTARVVVMGTGDASFIEGMRQLEQRYPQRFRLIVGFDEALSHQLEAAGDFFLMPSLFEPCGLNQIYSLRYGTVPLVRATGGLKDTVQPLEHKAATGIVFAEPTVAALTMALQQAVALYLQPELYQQVQQRGMAEVFDWPRAACEYLSLYQKVSS